MPPIRAFLLVMMGITVGFFAGLHGSRSPHVASSVTSLPNNDPAAFEDATRVCPVDEEGVLLSDVDGPSNDDNGKTEVRPSDANFFPSYAAPKRRERKLAALLTYLRDEETHLRMWFGHYRKFFDLDDMYILDNESKNPISSLGLGARVKTFGCPQSKYLDHNCLVDKVKETIRELLKYYRFVVFSEVDEIIAARDGLRNFMCNHFMVAVSRPLAFEPFQSPNESALNFSLPIVPQRSIGRYNFMYNKPAVVGRVYPYLHGFHTYWGAPNAKGGKAHPEVRDGLYLMHLKFADIDFCFHRLLWQKKQNFEETGKGVNVLVLQVAKRDDELRDHCAGPRNDTRIVRNITDDMRKAFDHPGGTKGWCETPHVLKNRTASFARVEK